MLQWALYFTSPRCEASCWSGSRSCWHTFARRDKQRMGNNEYKNINGICMVCICFKHVYSYALASTAQYVMYHFPAGFSCVVSASLEFYPHWVPHFKSVTSNFLASKSPTKIFLWGPSLITRNVLEVENKERLTVSKQAICISRAISTQPSSPYPYLSVCLSIWSPLWNSGAGDNEGESGSAERKNWLCRELVRR